MALIPEIQKLLQPQLDNSLHQQYGIIPQDVYSQIREREKADPELTRLRDTARAMQSGPIIAGAAEGAKILGGGAVNINPLLAWASGLPGAPKNLGAIAQANPYVSPTDTIGKLMGMGDAVSQANARYLDARQKFHASQGLGGGKLNPITAMLLRDALKQEGEARKAARDEKREADKISREEMNRIRDLDQKDQELALQIYDRWSNNAKNKDMTAALSQAVKSAEGMKGIYSVDPSRLYYELPGGFKLQKRVIPDMFRNPDAQEFYRNLDSFVLPLIRTEIGSQQTRQELEKQNKALAAGTLSDFNQLIKAINSRIDSITSAYEQTLGPLKASPGGAAYTMWKAYNTDYISQLRAAKLPLLQEPKKSSSGGKSQSTAPEPKQKPNTKGASDTAKKFLDDFLLPGAQ